MYIRKTEAEELTHKECTLAWRKLYLITLEKQRLHLRSITERSMFVGK